MTLLLKLSRFWILSLFFRNWTRYYIQSISLKITFWLTLVNHIKIATTIISFLMHFLQFRIIIQIGIFPITIVIDNQRRVFVIEMSLVCNIKHINTDSRSTIVAGLVILPSNIKFFCLIKLLSNCNYNN